MSDKHTAEITKLRLKVKRLEIALSNFISWTASSANSPIRIDEANRLLGMIDGADE